MPRRAETRKRRISGAVASMDMDRGETPGLRGGLAYGAGRSASPMPPKRPKSPHPPALHPAGVVGILCAGGKPARAAPGAYNTELAAAKGRSPEGGAPRGPRDGRKNFLKKVLDTAERAR